MIRPGAGSAKVRVDAMASAFESVFLPHPQAEALYCSADDKYIPGLATNITSALDDGASSLSSEIMSKGKRIVRILVEGRLRQGYESNDGGAKKKGACWDLGEGRCKLRRRQARQLQRDLLLQVSRSLGIRRKMKMMASRTP